MNARYPDLLAKRGPSFPLAPDEVFAPGSGTPGFQAFAEGLRGDGSSIVSHRTYAAADEDTVRAAQKRAGVVVDGLVGPQTWSAVLQGET